MQPFVSSDSVVRKIWGSTDTILFIFAGAAAEFALNKAVDWLYFTGRLPADPLGRLFSTVTYARKIVFSSEAEANAVIDSMAKIHQVVEEKRGYRIPAWAYRDVLYMLIDYSIRAWELLHAPLSETEKREVFDVFRRVGARMGLEELPSTYLDWLADRERHLSNDLAYSHYSADLYQQYRKHLGPLRYLLLRAGQGQIVPGIVASQLVLSNSILFAIIIRVYKIFARLRLDWHLKRLILPKQYMAQVRALDA